MRTLFLTIVITAAIANATAIAQLNTARNVAHSTVQGTKQAAQTVAHGVKNAADKVEDALTPDPDARRVDVTVTDDKIDMPTELERGKTSFVVKNDGKTAQNFEVEGHNIDRKFNTAPNPGETRVLNVTLKKGTYTVYAPGKADEKARKMTVKVK